MLILKVNDNLRHTYIKTDYRDIMLFTKVILNIFEIIKI